MNSENIKISVIIPTYNRSKLLNRSIRSVLNQTYQPNEIIVVDNGSTDDTREMVSKNFRKICYIYHDKKGVSSARNAGIRISKSNWISFLDSDDEWDPNHLDALRTYLKANPLLRWAQSEEVWIRNGSHFNKKHVHRKPDGWGFDRSLDRCLVSPSAVIIHRSMFNDFGLFDTNLMVCEDYDLWLRIGNGFRILIIKKYLGYYVERSGNITSRPYHLKIKNIFFILYKNRNDVNFFY